MIVGPYVARVLVEWDHGPGLCVAVLGLHAGVGYDSRASVANRPPPGCTQRVARWRGWWVSWGTRPPTRRALVEAP